MIVNPSIRLSIQDCARLLDTPGADITPALTSIQQWAVEPLTADTINLLTRMWTQQNVTEQALSRYLYFKANAIGLDRLFPYQILEKTGEVCKLHGLVKIYSMFVKVVIQNDDGSPKYEPGYHMSQQPGYIVNMPVVLGSDNERNRDEVLRILNLFQNQSFSDSATKSELKTRSRLAVVIGANRSKSIDKAQNMPFKQFKLLSLKPYEINLFGFFWKPVWHYKESTIQPTNPLKAARNFFAVLKKIDPTLANTIRISHEQPEHGVNKRVPYQEIRETIKNSIYTRRAVTKLRAYYIPRLLYLAVMDPDCTQLRNDGKGLFSHYNAIIKKGLAENDQAPSIMSTGYKAAANATPLMELTIRLDQNARAAMFSYFPGAPYLPEPNLMLQILPGTETVYESFMDPKLKGLESLHIVRHIVTARQLDKNVAIVFQRFGAIPTAVPHRFYTKLLSRPDPLSHELIGKEKVLKGLRGIKCQSHIFPLKGWAYNMARELSVGWSGDLNRTLTDILQVFDPISIARSYVDATYSAETHYYPMMNIYEYFHTIMLGIYNRLSREGAGRNMPPEEIQRILTDELGTAIWPMEGLAMDQKVKLYNLCYQKTGFLINTSNQFLALGVPLVETARVILTAAAVGNSIYQTLRFGIPNTARHALTQ